MTAGFAFGGFGAGRNFGIVDFVAFLAVKTGDVHLKGSKACPPLADSGFKVQGSRFKPGVPLNREPLT